MATPRSTTPAANKAIENYKKTVREAIIEKYDDYLGEQTIADIFKKIGIDTSKTIVVTATIDLSPSGSIISDDDLIDQITTVLAGDICHDMRDWVDEVVSASVKTP